MFYSKLVTVPRANKKWEVLHRDRVLTLPVDHRFRHDQKFFTIGSCFAEEIRKALTRGGVACYPEYRRISFDPSRVKIDTLPQREHMNYYNTFSIRQEIERVAGLWEQEKTDIWSVPGRAIVNASITGGDQTIFQDPYRRLVFGASPDDLWSAVTQINQVMRDGILGADVMFITLGMTEVFKKRNNGLVANQIPVYAGGAGLRETYFHLSGFRENYDNMHRALTLLRQLNPSIRVVLTVSPVPLMRTFTERDVYVANMQSKSTLRAVAGEIADAFDWVTYFPSYEIVMGMGVNAFEERDMIHVRENVVAGVIEGFMRAHMVPLPDPQATASVEAVNA